MTDFKGHIQGLVTEFLAALRAQDGVAAIKSLTEIGRLTNAEQKNYAPEKVHLLHKKVVDFIKKVFLDKPEFIDGLSSNSKYRQMFADLNQGFAGCQRECSELPYYENGISGCKLVDSGFNNAIYCKKIEKYPNGDEAKYREILIQAADPTLIKKHKKRLEYLADSLCEAFSQLRGGEAIYYLVKLGEIYRQETFVNENIRLIALEAIHKAFGERQDMAKILYSFYQSFRVCRDEASETCDAGITGVSLVVDGLGLKLPEQVDGVCIALENPLEIIKKIEKSTHQRHQYERSVERLHEHAESGGVTDEKKDALHLLADNLHKRSDDYHAEDDYHAKVCCGLSTRAQYNKTEFSEGVTNDIKQANRVLCVQRDHVVGRFFVAILRGLINIVSVGFSCRYNFFARSSFFETESQRLARNCATEVAGIGIGSHALGAGDIGMDVAAA